MLCADCAAEQDLLLICEEVYKMIAVDILRLAVTIVIAFFVGKAVSRLGLPAILGWLVTGMCLGPHALNVMNDELMNATWYGIGESILECTVGLMIGTELIWRQMKKAGKQIVVTTITESLGTFVVVSLVFGVIFYVTGTPLYLALLFGGIALATAPAPSLSIVNDMKASGPVTSTLIPMAVLDDLVGALVFFTVVAVVSSAISSSGVPLPVVLFLVFLPVLLGIMTGWVTGMLLRRMKTAKSSLITMVVMLLVSAGIGFFINNVILSTPIINFLLIGMAFSAVFANMIPEKQLADIMKVMNPIISFGLIILILNLGAPLDYHLVFGAGIYTAVYIVSRAIGKYAGAYFGAAVTGAPEIVKKYLGFTLLPHSGVSLVFTGIAVSMLEGPAPECAAIIQGTIAAAAVINEIIAVFIAKKGFEWAGELPDRKGKHMKHRKGVSAA